MKWEYKISFECPLELFPLLKKADFSYGRGKGETKKSKKTVVEIRAKDATALRAIVDNYLKGLKIYEATKKVLKNE